MKRSVCHWRRWYIKNSLSVKLESQKLRINILIISVHFSHSWIVHRHKEMSKMKTGCGHSLIPRLSLCFVNTLNRHMHTAMYSDYVCAKYDSNWWKILVLLEMEDKICQGNSEYWKFHHYFSFLNNCTSVLHTQISLIGRFHHSVSCWCR